MPGDDPARQVPRYATEATDAMELGEHEAPREAAPEPEAGQKAPEDNADALHKAGLQARELTPDELAGLVKGVANHKPVEKVVSAAISALQVLREEDAETFTFPELIDFAGVFLGLVVGERDHAAATLAAIVVSKRMATTGEIVRDNLGPVPPPEQEQAPIADAEHAS